MRSASPLVRNDPRLSDLVDRLRKGASLKGESEKMGYSHHVQLRNALTDALGVEAMLALMSDRAKVFRQKKNAVPVVSS
jgi:hypothetical protein